MPNTKQPFVYTLKHKMLGTPASSAATLPNHGVTKITAASTYTLAGPEVGSLVTLYSVGVDATIVSVSTVVGSTGQVSFDGAGGTAQKLNLLYDSTVANTPCVTMIGESATQWRIISVVGAPVNWVSSNAGVSVTT
jgi:hypothetical protein